MKKEELEELIDLGLSQRRIAEQLKYSQANVRYWLKHFGLKTKLNKHNIKYSQDIVEKFCPICKEIKPVEEFYDRRGRIGKSGYCKKCDNEYTQKRLINTKIKMIEYKGGHCIDCTLKLEDSHYSVFDFHHLDPNTKDPNFKQIKSQNWDKIKKEIDKCVLLCSNCHRIRHAKYGKIV